ncbi:MAG TPA: hypothetical protein VIJ47_11145, partial [Acidimicrobiales bacterium]
MSAPPGSAGAGGHDRRGRRVLVRAAGYGRRVAASVLALGSTRYSGGVDPVDPEDRTIPGPGQDVTTQTITGWARARPGQLVSVVVLVDDEPAALGLPRLADLRSRRGVTPWQAEVPLPVDGSVRVRAIAVLADGLNQPL